MNIPKEIADFLEKEKFCVIATSSKGKTEAATMGAVFNKGEVLMFTSKSSRKYANLKDNKNVALVFSAKDYSKNAQIDGVAELVEMSKAKDIIKIIIEKRPELREHIESKEDSETVFIVVKPTRICFSDDTKKPESKILLE